MPNNGNFNPEWGYLAPRPGFMRTARTVLLAGVVGTVGGMAVAAALIERPATEDVSVAARTMAQSSGSEVQPTSTASNATAELLDARAQHDVAPQPSAQLTENPRELKEVAAAESHSAATMQSPAGLAALAEAPAVRDDAAAALLAAMPARSASRPNKIETPANVAALTGTPGLSNGAAEIARTATPNPSSKRVGKVQEQESRNVVALAEAPALRDDASETLSDAAPTVPAKRPSKKVQAVHTRMASAEPSFRNHDSRPFDLLPFIGRTLFGGKPLFNTQVR